MTEIRYNVFTILDILLLSRAGRWSRRWNCKFLYLWLIKHAPQEQSNWEIENEVDILDNSPFSLGVIIGREKNGILSFPAFSVRWIVLPDLWSNISPAALLLNCRRMNRYFLFTVCTSCSLDFVVRHLFIDFPGWPFSLRVLRKTSSSCSLVLVKHGEY